MPFTGRLLIMRGIQWPREQHGSPCEAGNGMNGMNDKASEMSVYDMIKAGLEDSIAFSKGTISLATTQVTPAKPEQKPETVPGTS